MTTALATVTIAAWPFYLWRVQVSDSPSPAGLAPCESAFPQRLPAGEALEPQS